MHKDFGEWYRTAGIEPNGETLPKRWAGIEKLPISRDAVISLTRLFYSLGKPSDTFLTAFQAVFQAADPAFKMRDNDHELALLAGATLIHAIETTDNDISIMSAMALVCAAAQNIRPPAPVGDILQIAITYMHERAVRRSSTAQDDDAAHEEYAAHSEQLKGQGPPWETFAPVFQRLLEEHRALKNTLPIIAEETNMLWWLFSGYSRDMSQLWKKLTLPAAAVIAGKELADLTNTIPGPIAAIAFLDRAISRGKAKSSVTIKDALHDIPLEWRQRFASKPYPSELLDLTPIGQGIKLSITAPDQTWLTAFEQAAGFPADKKMPPYNLAYQVYLEALLCRSWDMLK